jgi:hypothetical protein
LERKRRLNQMEAIKDVARAKQLIEDYLEDNDIENESFLACALESLEKALQILTRTQKRV